jgi:carboxypeptidase Taq
MQAYEKLEARFRQIQRLSDVRAIVSWDEAVMMPAGGSQTRNESLAELSLVMQNLLSASEVGDWLREASENSTSMDPWMRANLREMKRQYFESTAVSPELNQRLNIAKMNCEQKWRVLRADNDWTGFMPYLQEVLNLTREVIAQLQTHTKLAVYDQALALYSPGLSTNTVDCLFTELKSFLPGMISEVIEKQKSEKVLIPKGPFPMAAQKALGLELMQAVGFSIHNGRLDESHHPFCGGTSRDVRITTRYNEGDFISSLMGVLHESGHAIYEQHLPEAWLTQPVGIACGMSIHESQSLLMEMQVCRSKEFLTFATPIIRKHMLPYVDNPAALEAENLIKLWTRVERGLIRTEADELTYPAHVILRFEIERDLLENRWPLKELPAAWNEKMKSYLGLSTLGNDKDGCMQDVHWPSGGFGYFPAYTFGAVIAAQLFAAASRDFPGISAGIAKGDFSHLHGWLNEKIWSRGSSVHTLEMVEDAAGPLSAAPFRKHLESRYLD